MFSGIVSEEGSVLAAAFSVTVKGAGHVEGLALIFALTVYDESIWLSILEKGLKQLDIKEEKESVL